MTISDRARAAQAALEIPLFTELMDELEKAAINQCINAPINDDETRRNAAAEVRAIRSVRSRLESIAKEGNSTGNRQAPA